MFPHTGLVKQFIQQFWSCLKDIKATQGSVKHIAKKYNSFVLTTGASGVSKVRSDNVFIRTWNPTRHQSIITKLLCRFKLMVKFVHIHTRINHQ